MAAAPHLLSTGHYAQLVCVSPRLVRRWVALPAHDPSRLPSYRLPGIGQYRIDLQDGLRYAQEHHLFTRNLEEFCRRHGLPVVWQPAALLFSPDADYLMPLVRQGFDTSLGTDCVAAGAILRSRRFDLAVLDGAMGTRDIRSMVLWLAGNSARTVVAVLAEEDDASDWRLPTWRKPLDMPAVARALWDRLQHGKGAPRKALG